MLKELLKELLEGIDLPSIGLLSCSFGSEKEQLQEIKNNPYNIKFIYSPTEKVQIAAVKQIGAVIRYINNPSEKVQEIAVERACSLFPNITSEKVIRDFLNKRKMQSVLE